MREGMVQAIRSKRYPYARVNRLLTHALLDTRAPGIVSLAAIRLPAGL